MEEEERENLDGGESDAGTETGDVGGAGAGGGGGDAAEGAEGAGGQQVAGGGMDVGSWDPGQQSGGGGELY